MSEMNDHPNGTPNDQGQNQEESWEMRVQENARQFAYPPTPDVAARVRIQRLQRRPTVVYRRLAQVAAAILIVLIAMMAVPEIRAAVFEILRIGSVRIFQTAPTASLTPQPSQTARPTPVPLPTPLQSVLDLPGETTLENARATVNFEIRYPPSLGEPERVFLQQMEDWQVVLMWERDGAPISLHIMPSATFQAKFFPRDPVTTRVNSSPAYWFDEPHLFMFWLPNGDEIQRDITDNVLLWELGDLTYRIESSLDLEAAQTLAEEIVLEDK